MDKITEILIGTNNVGKYKEICDLLPKKVKKYSLEEFKKLEVIAWKMGFSMVSCSPLTRSSYHADEHFERLKITNA